MEIFKLFGTIGIKNKDANRAIDETTGKAETASGKITSTFKKLAVGIGVIFAGKQLFDFGRSAVEAAATAKAIQAQFTSVFGELVPQATETVNKMAKNMGILPERLNPMFTKLSAKYKGLGASTEEAMNLAAKGTTLAADAAAFYDKSLEDTSSALNSFINGNYEGGEAIGLFANETQLASWASEHLGVNWKELDEKGKQIARLKFAEAMQKAAGATGQASREADGFENVMGNLRASWEKFKALVGGPLLAPVVKGLQSATEWLQKAGDWVKKLQDKLQDNGAIQSFSGAFSNIKSVIGSVVGGIADFVGKLLGVDKSKSSVDQVAEAIQKVGQFLEKATGRVKDFITWFKNGGTAVGVFKASVASLTAVWTAYKIAVGIIKGIETARNVVLGISNGLMLARFVQTGALTAAEGAHAAATVAGTGAMTAFNAVMALNPITAVLVALTALTAGLIYFFTQTETGKKIWQDFMTFLGNIWDSIKVKAEEIWNAVLSVVNTVVSEVVSFVQSIFGTLVSWWQENQELIKSTAETVWNAISSVISTVVGVITSVIQTAMTFLGPWIEAAWTNIQTIITTVWNVIKTVVETAINAVLGIIKAIMQAITGDWSGAWETIKGTLSTVWEGMKSIVSTVISAISTIITTSWQGISETSSRIFNGIKNTIENVFNGIKSTASNIWDGIKTAITNAINGAKTAVSNAVKKLKSIMNFKWSLPKLKLPRITISGSFSLMPPRVPSFGLSWHAKGGIMSSPTLFGFDGKNFHAGGEAGDEAILPLNEKTLRPIGQQIADSAGLNRQDTTVFFERIIELLEKLLEKSTDVYIDREKISRIIYDEFGIIARREA